MHSSVHVFNITFFYLQDGLSSARVYNCQFGAALSVNEVIVDKGLQRKDCITDLMRASTGKISVSLPFWGELALQQALLRTCRFHHPLPCDLRKCTYSARRRRNNTETVYRTEARHVISVSVLRLCKQPDIKYTLET